MSMSELQEEKEFLDAHRQELFEKYPGKFALIKGSRLVGVYDTDEYAYNEGVRLLGNVPMLIHEILEKDVVYQIPAYFAGVLHVAV